MIRFLAALLLLTGLADLAAAQSGYRIQPGDTLQVEVLEDPNLNRGVLVLPDGSISFPLAGTVRAGGRNVDQVAQSLTAELAGNFAVEPTVLVSVAALAPDREPEPELIDVYIVGEVARLMAEELDKDDAWASEQASAYKELAREYLLA